MQSVCSPAQLPSAKILLPALLVQVGKNKEQQQGDNARYDDHTGGDVIHVLALTPRFPGGSAEFLGIQGHVFTRHSHRQ